MKKQELLKQIDNELLEKLYGFCYARTADSHEGQELCSDILFALVKAAGSEGEIERPHPFIWRVARNVYADFANRRRQRTDSFYQGNPEDLLPLLPAPEPEEEDCTELLDAVYHRIAFLTKAYRETMIGFYLDGLSTAEIARRQNASETAVRQRLFSARKRVRNEVEEMKETCNKPVALDTIEFYMWGNGDPGGNDPRETCTRQFSRHIVWLCRKRPLSASEIAEQLGVPTLYVEEELDILARGQNGEYGLLRRLDSGKYALNFVLFDRETIEKAWDIYTEHLPAICGIIAEFIEENREEYLAFPYLNRKFDLNLILWQQLHRIADTFSRNVERILSETHFSQLEKPSRPFNVYAHQANGKLYRNGWDGVLGSNLCGYSTVQLDNIYTAHIREHFHCGLNLATDLPLQLALRAIGGLAVSSLTEAERESAARAVEEGYLYREDNMLYTKILVHDLTDVDRLFAVTNRLSRGYFEESARIVAGKLSELFRRVIPDYLLPEWRLANDMSSLPFLDSLADFLITKGVLTPPRDGIGAEGCWMGVSAASSAPR